MSTVVIESLLNKQGHINKGWKERWCVLQDDGQLHYYAQKNDKQARGSTSLKHVTAIKTYPSGIDKHTTKQRTDSLSELHFDTNPSKFQKRNRSLSVAIKRKNKYRFDLITSNRTWIFGTNNVNDYQLWLNNIRKLTFGEALHEGYLRKIGGKRQTWKRRYFIIYDKNEIRYFVNNTLAQQKGMITLKSITNITAADPNEYIYPYCFKLSTPGRVYILSATSSQERDIWLNGIQSVMQKQAKTIKTFVASTTGHLSVYDGSNGTYKWTKYYVAVDKQQAENRLCCFENHIQCKQLESTTSYDDQQFEALCQSKIKKIISFNELTNISCTTAWKFKKKNKECTDDMNGKSYLVSVKLNDNQRVYFAPHPNTEKHAKRWANIIRELKPKKIGKLPIANFKYSVSSSSSSSSVGNKILNTNNYINWDINDVIQWFISFDNGRIYKKYPQLSYNLRKSNISGKALKTINDPDLKRFGVKDDILRGLVLEAINGFKLIPNAEEDVSDDEYKGMAAFLNNIDNTDDIDKHKILKNGIRKSWSKYIKSHVTGNHKSSNTQNKPKNNNQSDNNNNDNQNHNKDGNLNDGNDNDDDEKKDDDDNVSPSLLRTVTVSNTTSTTLSPSTSLSFSEDDELFILDSATYLNDKWLTNNANFSIKHFSFINDTSTLRIVSYFIKPVDYNPNGIHNEEYFLVQCPGNSGGKNGNKGASQTSSNANNGNSTYSVSSGFNNASGIGGGSGGKDRDNSNNNNNNNKPSFPTDNSSKNIKKKPKKKDDQTNDESDESDDEKVAQVLSSIYTCKLVIPKNIETQLKINKNELVFVETKSSQKLSIRYDHSSQYLVLEVNETKNNQNKYKLISVNNNNNDLSLRDAMLDVKPYLKTLLNVVKRNSGSKRKSKSNKNRSKRTHVAYNPLSKYRVKGNIKVSKELTTQIIPGVINENICDVYNYLDKSTALQLNDINIKYSTKIINVDFHCKKTKEILYCVIKENDQKQSAYKWKMVDKLFTANELNTQYFIQQQLLPQSSRLHPIFMAQLNCENSIANIFKNKDKMNNIWNQTKWNKINILNKIENGCRRTICVTKENFVNKCKDFLTFHKNNLNIIPILVFNREQYYIEYLWIIKFDDINIGISLKYNDQYKKIKIIAIHLDKDAIKSHHQLAVPDHQNMCNCNCLSQFECNIDELRIGNPDDLQNKINCLRNQLEQQKSMDEYKTNPQNQISNIQSPTNIQSPPVTDQFSLQKWLKDECNLEEYYNVLVDNGFEDMYTLKTLTELDLIKMKIKKMGHRKKLLGKIKDYQ